MLFLACLLPCATFKSAWWAARRFLGFCPAGVGWIYHAVDLIFLSVCAVAFFKAIRHLEHTGYPQFEVGES